MKSVIFGGILAIALSLCGVDITDWQFWVAVVLINAARVFTMENSND